MAGIDALREGGAAAEKKTKGAIKGAKKGARASYEKVKEKVKE